MSLMIASTKKAETPQGHRNQTTSISAGVPEESPLERSRRAAVERKNSNAGEATAANPVERQESQSDSRSKHRERQRDRDNNRVDHNRRYKDEKNRSGSTSRDRTSRDRERERERDSGNQQQRNHSRSNSFQGRRQHHRSERSPDRDRSQSRDDRVENAQRRSRSRQRSDDRNRSRDKNGSRTGGHGVKDGGNGKESVNIKNQKNTNNSGERGSRKKSSSSDTSRIPVVVQGQKSQRSDYKVREIWLGNLPENISRQVLYSHFFICGEIEEIEILKQPKGSPLYAFLRFKLTSCTKRAYDIAQALEIDGNKIKVQFSDFNRRGFTIVGDVPEYDLTPGNCTTLFIAFSVGLQLPNQTTFETVFSQYGRVRAIWMKQTESYTKYRPHAFVDYFEVDNAQRAKREMYDQDSYGMKRMELGDKSCEILFAIKKRNKDFNNQLNNGGGQNNNQNQRSQFSQQHPQFHQTPPMMNMMGHQQHQQQMSGFHQHISPFQAGMQHHQQMSRENSQQQQSIPQPHIQAQASIGGGNNMQQQQQYFGVIPQGLVAAHAQKQQMPQQQQQQQNQQNSINAQQQQQFQQFGGAGQPQQQQQLQQLQKHISNANSLQRHQTSPLEQSPNPPAASPSQSLLLQQQQPMTQQQQFQKAQVHAMVQQVLSMPALQIMRQSNPEIAAKLEIELQRNPDPKNISVIIQSMMLDYRNSQQTSSTGSANQTAPGAVQQQTQSQQQQPQQRSNLALQPQQNHHQIGTGQDGSQIFSDNLSVASNQSEQQQQLQQINMIQQDQRRRLSSNNFNLAPPSLNEHSYESNSLQQKQIHTTPQYQMLQPSNQQMQQQQAIIRPNNNLNNPPGSILGLQQPQQQMQNNKDPTNVIGSGQSSQATNAGGAALVTNQNFSNNNQFNNSNLAAKSVAGVNQQIAPIVANAGALPQKQQIFDQGIRPNQQAFPGMMRSPPHSMGQQSASMVPSQYSTPQGQKQAQPDHIQNFNLANVSGHKQQQTNTKALPVPGAGYPPTQLQQQMQQHSPSAKVEPAKFDTSFNIVDFIKQQKHARDEEESSQTIAAAKDGLSERAAEEVIRTEPVNLLDDDEKSIWSGFVTRNKQFRVCMMAYTVSGDNNEFYLPDRLYNLNVSLRANYEDVQNFESQGVVAFVPQGDTYEDQFQEYIDYFEKKQRVGLAFLDKGIMFLLPPCELSRQYFTSDRPHMVGIFGDQQAAAAQSAQFGRQASNNTNIIRQSQEMGSKMM